MWIRSRRSTSCRVAGARNVITLPAQTIESNPAGWRAPAGPARRDHRPASTGRDGPPPPRRSAPGRRPPRPPRAPPRAGTPPPRRAAAGGVARVLLDDAPPRARVGHVVLSSSGFLG